jgi:hypothetical protein
MMRHPHIVDDLDPQEALPALVSEEWEQRRTGRARGVSELRERQPPNLRLGIEPLIGAPRARTPFAVDVVGWGGRSWVSTVTPPITTTRRRWIASKIRGHGEPAR